MGNRRDNFNQDTIRKAAGRVGYRCSFPGCQNATIGASMESNDKVVITGVAAHICAAAKGGPRYDENMTVDERKNIDNCIWLCQTHSKLIDSDVNTYTVDVLRQWKSDAESLAAKILATGDYFSEYFKVHENNLVVLSQMFDDMIIEGQFNLLQTLLEQYKNPLSEQYEEFVLRYKIIYDVYCKRSNLSIHLNDYCSLVCKFGVDILVKLFLSFHLKEELNKIVEYCVDKELKKYAELAIKDKLISLILVPIGSEKTIELSEDLFVVISKYITNHIVQNNILGVVNVTGVRFTLFSDEFYYSSVKAAYELACVSIYGNDNFEDIEADSNFLFIKNNIDKIALLDDSLQEYIWMQFLSILSEKPKEFAIYYERCSKSLKDVPLIKKAYYMCKIKNDVGSIDCNNLVDYVSKTGEDDILCMYLSSIERNSAIEFLDEHGYLLKKDSIYLKLKLDLLSDFQSQKTRNFLFKYNEVYKNDFTFHLLLANCVDADYELDKELKWLESNKDKMRLHDCMDYIQIIRKHEYWDDLIELSQVQLPSRCEFYLATCLIESEDIGHVNTGLKLYLKLVDIGLRQRRLYFNMGVAYRKLGDFDKSKECFKSEYKIYSDLFSLKALIQLRYELNEYKTDFYFNQLKECIDANSQNLIAVIYLKTLKYSEARKYFLRSLLLEDENNPSINGIYQVLSHIPSKDVGMIEANVFCVLENDSSRQYIAIHEPDILEGIVSPKTFACYSHYSTQDVRASCLLFASQGDTVVWDNQDYTVAEIMSANDAIKHFYISRLSKLEGVKVIRDEKDLVAQISDVLQKSSENLNNLINQYNQLEVRLPLSKLAYYVGEGMLKTCEFLLFENREKIRNNVSIVSDINDKTTFVLSYDAILNLVHLGVGNALLKQFDLICSNHVKNQLLNDIDVEVLELTDESRQGTMFIKEGKLTLFHRTADIRRGRYSFLMQLKSFVKLVRTTNNVPTFTSNNDEIKADIKKFFLNRQLYCESTSLAVAQYISDSVLVTDDQFLFTLAKLEGIPTVGLTGLLSNSDLSWDCLLSASKKLKNMNFGNYLPVHLYQRIIDQMLRGGSNCKTASKEIITWVLSDTDADATSYHEDIVIELYSEIIKQGLNYLNPENYLTNFVLNVFEKRKPGFINNFISNAFGTLKSTE